MGIYDTLRILTHIFVICLSAESREQLFHSAQTALRIRSEKIERQTNMSHFSFKRRQIPTFHV